MEMNMEIFRKYFNINTCTQKIQYLPPVNTLIRVCTQNLTGLLIIKVL